MAAADAVNRLPASYACPCPYAPMHPSAILSSTNYSRVRCGHRGNPDYHGRENESLRARQHTDADQAEDKEPTRRLQEHDCAGSGALFEPSYVKTGDLPRQARDKRKRKVRVSALLMRSFIRRRKRSANAPSTTPANAPAPTDQNPSQLARC